LHQRKPCTVISLLRNSDPVTTCSRDILPEQPPKHFAQHSLMSRSRHLPHFGWQQGSAEFGFFELCGSFFNKSAAELQTNSALPRFGGLGCAARLRGLPMNTE
jgi:hypothetical protein